MSYDTCLIRNKHNAQKQCRRAIEMSRAELSTYISIERSLWPVDWKTETRGRLLRRWGSRTLQQVTLKSSLLALILLQPIFSSLLGNRWCKTFLAVKDGTVNVHFLKKWANPGLFFVYFRLFKQTLQLLQQINVKHVHPVTSAAIRTHNLLITSLLT